MNSLQESSTWTSVRPVPGDKAIGSKWAYSVKNGGTDHERYKQKMVAQKFMQDVERGGERM